MEWKFYQCVGVSLRNRSPYVSVAPPESSLPFSAIFYTGANRKTVGLCLFSDKNINNFASSLKPLLAL